MRYSHLEQILDKLACHHRAAKTAASKQIAIATVAAAAGAAS